MRVILDGSANSFLALSLFVPSEVILLTYSFAGTDLNRVELDKLKIKCETLGLSVQNKRCYVGGPSIFSMALATIADTPSDIYHTIDPFYLTKEVGSQKLLIIPVQSIYPNLFDSNKEIKEKIYSNYFLDSFCNSYFSSSRNFERLEGFIPGDLNKRRPSGRTSPNKLYNLFYKPMFYSSLGVDINDLLVDKQSCFAEMYDYPIS